MPLQTQVQIFFHMWQTVVMQALLVKLKTVKDRLESVTSGIWSKNKSELIEIAMVEAGLTREAAARRTVPELRLEIKEVRDSIKAAQSEALMPKNLTKLNKAQLQIECRMRNMDPTNLKCAEMTRNLRLWAEAAEYYQRSDIGMTEVHEYVTSKEHLEKTYTDRKSTSSAIPVTASVETDQAMTNMETELGFQMVANTSLPSTPVMASTRSPSAPVNAPETTLRACGASAPSSSGGAESGAKGTLPLEQMQVVVKMAEQHMEELVKVIHDNNWSRHEAVLNMPKDWIERYPEHMLEKMLVMALHAAPLAAQVPLDYPGMVKSAMSQL